MSLAALLETLFDFTQNPNKSWGDPIDGCWDASTIKAVPGLAVCYSMTAQWRYKNWCMSASEKCGWFNSEHRIIFRWKNCHTSCQYNTLEFIEDEENPQGCLHFSSIAPGHNVSLALFHHTENDSPEVTLNINGKIWKKNVTDEACNAIIQKLPPHVLAHHSPRMQRTANSA